MRLTQHTDYALRALLYLGASNGGRHTIADIAQAYGISRNHLTKVVQNLSGHGFISATRGKGGGLTLGCAASDIVVGEVVRKMEPSDTLVECFSPQGECAIEGPCRLAGALHEAYSAFLSTLDDYTLEDLLDRRRSRLRQVLKITSVEQSQ